VEASNDKQLDHFSAQSRKAHNNDDWVFDYACPKLRVIGMAVILGKPNRRLRKTIHCDGNLRISSHDLGLWLNLIWEQLELDAYHEE
jgi:hypothetical protein